MKRGNCLARENKSADLQWTTANSECDMDFFPNKKDFYQIELEKIHETRTDNTERVEALHAVRQQETYPQDLKRKNHKPEQEEVKDHFQDVARGHFIVRRLERSYDPELVKKEYLKLPAK